MKTAGPVLGVALLIAALGGCSHQEAQSAAPQTPQVAQTQTRSVCPLAQLEGVKASVADTADGVAITFTAPQSALSQLKQNVRGMKEANDTRGDPFAVCPCAQTLAGVGVTEAMPPSDQDLAAPGGPGVSTPTSRSAVLSALPAADSKMETTPTGVVLVLKAKERSQIPALRSAVQRNIESLQHGCLVPGQRGTLGTR